MTDPLKTGTQSPGRRVRPSNNQRLVLTLLIGMLMGAIVMCVVGYGLISSGAIDLTGEGVVRPTLDAAAATESSQAGFSFAITSDIRRFTGPGKRDTSQYFRGAVEALSAQESTDFMVVNGDMGTLVDVGWTLEEYLGSDYLWYPLVGGHELPGEGIESKPGDLMAELRAFDYGDVNPGPSGCPETTYSFDYENVHFVMLNLYCNRHGDTATMGDVPAHLYNWLVSDLSATTKEHIFVFGHEPAYPQPDTDNECIRHLGGSLDANPKNRDRFWELLSDEGVVFYANGHTHCFSVVQIDGVWQLDSGHAAGLGGPEAQSTFLIIYVKGGSVEYHAYRDDGEGGLYTLAYSGVLK